MPPITFVVDRREAGQTLAAVLRSRFGLSWSQAKRLVEGKHVRVSGQVESDVARRLRGEKGGPGSRDHRTEGVRRQETGDRRQEGGDRRQERAKTATQRTNARVKTSFTGSCDAGRPGIEIVYSDDAVVVVNKPAGLTTMRHKEEAAEFGERGRKFLPTTLADLLPGLLGTPDSAGHRGSSH